MHTLLLVSGENIHEQMIPFSVDFLLPPYEEWLTQNEIERMAKAYDIDPNNLHALAGKMPDWVGEEAIVQGDRLGRISRRNKNAKFDDYEIGGRYEGYLRPANANPTGFIARMIGKAAAQGVNQALKGEINHQRIVENPPGALLHAGTWIEAPYATFSDEDWRRHFISLFEQIPDNLLLTVVDKHL